MSTPYWPVCPRLHHGVMISDPCGPGPHAREWVCRTCGTRLYPTSNGGAAPAAISTEAPVTSKGNFTGRPREAPAHYGKSKERERNYIQANPRAS
jgi:hypothetical protein